MPLRIQDIRFSVLETAVIHTRATTVLVGQGVSQQEAVKIIKTLTPQNVLRLALGFERRSRGGSRPNAGRPKPAKAVKAKKQKPE